MRQSIDKNDPVRLARIAVMAAMETGNPKRARTVLAELADENRAAADSIMMDVVRSYGVTLI